MVRSIPLPQHCDLWYNGTSIIILGSCECVLPTYLTACQSVTPTCSGHGCATHPRGNLECLEIRLLTWQRYSPSGGSGMLGDKAKDMVALLTLRESGMLGDKANDMVALLTLRGSGMLGDEAKDVVALLALRESWNARRQG